jgi:hypothetical protein
MVYEVISKRDVGGRKEVERRAEPLIVVVAGLNLMTARARASWS